MALVLTAFPPSSSSHSLTRPQQSMRMSSGKLESVGAGSASPALGGAGMPPPKMGGAGIAPPKAGGGGSSSSDEPKDANPTTSADV